MGAWHAVVNVCFRRGCRLFALDRCALRCDTSTLYPRPIDRSSRRTAGIGALDASRCERMTDRRRLLLIAVIAFLAAIAGAFIGRAFIAAPARSEEHTSELQSLMRISYAVFCLKKKKNKNNLISLTSDTTTCIEEE